MLDFLITASAIVVTLSGTGWLLQAEWNRARCAYLVFERTHAELTGSPAPPLPFDVVIRVSDDPGGVSGSGSCGGARESLRLRKLDERGIFHLPMGLALVVTLTTSIALVGLMHRWEALTETQLRLDRCAGKSAIALKRSIETMQAANLRMTAIRASLNVSSLAPPVRATLEAALAAEALHEKLEQGRWEARRALWLVRRGCDSRGDVPLPLPAFPWRDQLPDSLGPKPMAWDTDRTKSFHIEIGHAPRHAAAEVIAETGKGDPTHEISGKWKLAWAPPRGLLGAIAR